MKIFFFILLTTLGVRAQGPMAPPTTIYGTVRNLAGEIIDNPEFELIAVFADGVEVGRVPLEWNATVSENYRVEIPNVSVVSAAAFTVKLIRDGTAISIFDATLAFASFQPIQGQLEQFDFTEISDSDDGTPGDGPPNPVAPPTTIFGTVRDLAGEIIDNPGFEKIAVYADGVEIGRVPLSWNATASENYRFEIPNFSEVSTASYSVKLLRDSQSVSISEAGMPSLTIQPIQGQLVRLDFVEVIDTNNDGLPDVETEAPPTTIFGTVRNLAGEIIDQPNFEKIAIYIDGVELGQVSLESIPDENENYRFDIPNFSVLSQASYSVKLIRDGQQVSIIEPGMPSLTFQPVQGQLVRFDFIEIVDTDNDGVPDSDAEPPVAPPTTVFGTVRNLAGDLIDDPLFDEIAFYLDGVEIGRVPLESVAGENENYRFDLPNLSVLSTATYSAKLIRDSQQVSIFEPDFELFLYQPIQGTLKRFDFVEKPDVDLDGIPDELETVDLSPDGDYDNDGLTDLQELAIETDPADWLSGVNFKIIRVLPNGDLEAAFDVVTGFTYTLQVTTDLRDWVEVSSLTATSTTRETISTAPVVGDSVFWRIYVR